MTTTSAAPCPLHPWIAQPCNICTTTFSVAPAQGEPQPIGWTDGTTVTGHYVKVKLAGGVSLPVGTPLYAAAAIAALRAERDALRAELAEDAGGWARAERAEAERERLRADAERLDWLDVNWHGAIFGKNERGYLPWADGVDYQPTLRAAIDAARGKP